MKRNIIGVVVTIIITVYSMANSLCTLDAQIEEAVGPIGGKSTEPITETIFEESITESEVPFEKETEQIPQQIVSGIIIEETEIWDGPVLNSVIGTVEGPSGKETYYNLDMSYCADRMRDKGYCYDYWVRDDGVKMFGKYVMCAADLNIRPLGTIVPTSLGDGIVCDTGYFALGNPMQLDIAVTW